MAFEDKCGGAEVMNKAMNNSATLVPLATAASGRCPGRILCDSGLQPPALCDSGLRPPDPSRQRPPAADPTRQRPSAAGPGSGLLCALAVSEPVAPSSLSQAAQLACAFTSNHGCFRCRKHSRLLYTHSHANRPASFRKQLSLLSPSFAVAFAFTSIRGCSRKQPSLLSQAAHSLSLSWASTAAPASSPRHFRKPAFVFASSPGRFGKQPR